MQLLSPSILHVAIFIVAVAVAFTTVDCCHFSIVVSVILYGGCSHLVQCYGLLWRLLLPWPSPTVDCCHYLKLARIDLAVAVAFSCDAILLLLAFALAIAG